MYELLFFIIGITLGLISGIILMCLLQVKRINELEEKLYEKKKCSNTFPS